MAIARSITLLLIIFSLRLPLWAKDLYVAPEGGSDSTTYANNDIDHPWATPSHAWDLALAGDTVYFRGGTYTITSTVDTRALGSADGTALNPITFKNYPGETVTFDGTGGSWGSWPGAMVLVEQDYNYIEGIDFTNCRTAIQFAYDNNVSGGRVSGCDFTNFAGANDGENYAAIVVYGASSVSIQGCAITGAASHANGNDAGITAFTAPGLDILHCEISSVPSGIYYKHWMVAASDTDIDIAYNYIHDTTRTNYAIFLNCHYADVHDNIIGGAGGGFAIRESNGGPGGTHNTINHNTVYSGNLILGWDDFAATYNTITNNVFINRPQIGNNGDAGTESTMNTTADYNLYPTPNVVRYDGVQRTLSAWQSILGGDANSLSSAPTFDGGAAPSTIAGYALTAASAGYQACADSSDMGANVALVGVSPSGSGGTSPAPPTISNVTISNGRVQ